MSPLAALLVRTVRAAGLLARGDRVAVAVSGGGDSVALVHLLAEAAPVLGVTLAGVVHVNHGIRGAEAEADEACARARADALGLPFVVERATVAQVARARRCSIEAAGREVRETAFERAREALGATHVATGHTMDDQAETLLLRLARGTGVAALAGIRPARGHLVRPLLGTRRQALREYLAARAIGWREDASNADAAVARNRVRHRVLPVLARELSPRVVEALARAAALAAGEDAVLDDLARQALSSVGGDDAGGRGLDAAALTALPPALQRRVVRRWLDLAPGLRGQAGLAHVEAVRRLARAGREGARLALPAATIALRGGRLSCGDVPVAAAVVGGAGTNPADGPCHLPVPGVLCLEAAGLRVSVDVLTVGAGQAPALAVRHAGPAAAVVDAAAVGQPLAVRTRRRGDWLRPLGMAGRKTLQDLFVDRKVPRHQRDVVPLVVDAHDRIVWVGGHAIAAGARVTSSTTRVLLLQMQRSGGVV